MGGSERWNRGSAQGRQACMRYTGRPSGLGQGWKNVVCDPPCVLMFDASRAYSGILRIGGPGPHKQPEHEKIL